MKKLAARRVNALVCMRPEIIALRLQQVRRKAFAAIAVVITERGGKRRNRNAVQQRGGGHPAPPGLRGGDAFRKKWGEEQIRQIGLPVERLLDFPQKRRADNAAAAPHQRDPAVVQRPAVGRGRGPHQRVPLRIRHDFRSV